MIQFSQTQIESESKRQETCHPEATVEARSVKAMDVDDVVAPEHFHADPADSGQAAHGKWGQEGVHFLRLDDSQLVLVPTAVGSAANNSLFRNSAP